MNAEQLTLRDIFDRPVLAASAGPSPSLILFRPKEASGDDEAATISLKVESAKALAEWIKRTFP